MFLDAKWPPINFGGKQTFEKLRGCPAEGMTSLAFCKLRVSSDFFKECSQQVLPTPDVQHLS